MAGGIWYVWVRRMVSGRNTSYNLKGKDKGLRNLVVGHKYASRNTHEISRTP